MRAAALFLASVSVAALASCGSSDAPIDDVPALAGALQTLDDAIVAGDYREARAAVRELKGLTSQASSSGTLSEDETRQILSAAASVATDLRELQPSHDIATPETSPTPSEGASEGEGNTQGEDQGEGKDKSKDKGKSKGKHGEEPGNSEDAAGHNKDE